MKKLFLWDALLPILTQFAVSCQPITYHQADSSACGVALSIFTAFLLGKYLVGISNFCIGGLGRKEKVGKDT